LGYQSRNLVLYIRELDNGDYTVGGNDGPHLEVFIMPNENELCPCRKEIFEYLDVAVALSYIKELNII